MLSLPLALFVNTIRNTTKSILEVATWCSEAANIPAPSATVQYVLDGGASLHSIPWTRGETYDQNGVSSLFRQVYIQTGRYSDRSLFRQVYIPTGRYSDRTLFRQVYIPTGRYSDRSLFRQVYILTGRYSDRSLLRQFLDVNCNGN